ncbi:LCP family protein [Dactylosporangium sp. AC04546]|uniref:LCP family protein n=1 Tax=Dactylosporangium sp. AC04546 TaxID=2862460 RepID=UPI001EDF36AD|nr:LCP family protein [Dactylosporangium sp. AC04546]WVK88831.1 LCP family protein [Dactylosporangium sp. AC04546]
MLGTVLAVLAGAVLVAKEALFTYALRGVAQQNLLGDSGNRDQQIGHASVTGAKNILLIGVDARPGQDPHEPVRSDSIIILHIPASYDAAYLVSIPRDTWVEIPPYDNGARQYPGGHDKINAAFAYGGNGLAGTAARGRAVELLALTIKKLCGVTFDGAAIVDFTGFQQVVNVLGGVDMYVDQETTSVSIGHNSKGETVVPFRQYTRDDGGQGLDPVPGVTPVVYHVGYQHLEPWQALDYVRQRETLPNGDYDRQRHQQQFIKAVFKRMLSKDMLTNPVRFNKVGEVAGKAMTIDNGGIDLADWAYAMRGVSGDDVLTIKSNEGTFNQSPGNGTAEELDRTTVNLLTAVRTDKVKGFVTAHPELVAGG